MTIKNYKSKSKSKTTVAIQAQTSNPSKPSKKPRVLKPDKSILPQIKSPKRPTRHDDDEIDDDYEFSSQDESESAVSTSDESPIKSKKPKLKQKEPPIPDFITQPVYLNLAPQLTASQAPIKKTRKPRAKKQKLEVEEDKVEVIPIKYICPSNKHPNHSFDEQIDRWPINEIVGFGNYITRNDVSNSLNYPLINKI